METIFEFAKRRLGEHRDGLIQNIKDDIDSGLPCVLGWSGEGIGDHAVLVHGYASYSGSEWLLLEDPSGDVDIEVDQLVRLKRGELSYLRCHKHGGCRPEKKTVARDGHGHVTSRKLEHWNREDQAWDTTFEWPLPAR